MGAGGSPPTSKLVMNVSTLRKYIPVLLLGLAALATGGSALADPPSRVARLAYVSGAISFSPAGEDEWVRATLNRPLTTGDRIWADRAARTELQLGDLAVRLGASTSVTLLNVDDRVAQLQLAQGVLNLRVRQLDRNHTVEVDTPNLAFVIRRPGSYRVEVDADGSATAVMVRSGQAEVLGEGRAFVVEPGHAERFYGTGLTDYESIRGWQPDEFDRWASARDRRWDESRSARYVPRGLIGVEDLDDNGSWREVPEYGPVWTPYRVAANWAPYRDGHWAWVEPWGWTWIDDAPWGFAPSHYGRWAHIGGNWGWIPGPVAARPVYAPALVAFIGNANVQASISIGSVAWFALGPRDVYRPSYHVSREYFNHVNTSNTVINTTNITNVYNNTTVNNIVYVNQRVPGAVVAVPSATFTQARPVAQQAMPVNWEAMRGSAIVAAAPVAPERRSVWGGAASASARPPPAAQERATVAQTAPPPAPIAFVAKQRALEANAGKPLDNAALAMIKPTAPAVAAPAVKVVTAPAPVALPTQPANAGNAGMPKLSQRSDTMPPQRADGPQQADGPQRADVPQPGNPLGRRPGDERDGRDGRDGQARGKPLPQPMAAEPSRPVPAPPAATIPPPMTTTRPAEPARPMPRPADATPPAVVAPPQFPSAPQGSDAARNGRRQRDGEERMPRDAMPVPRPPAPHPAEPPRTLPAPAATPQTAQTPPVSAAPQSIAKPPEPPQPARPAPPREAQPAPAPQRERERPNGPQAMRSQEPLMRPQQAVQPEQREQRAASMPASMPAPTQAGSNNEPRRPPQRAEPERANDRREAASEARKNDEARRRGENEGARKP